MLPRGLWGRGGQVVAGAALPEIGDDRSDGHALIARLPTTSVQILVQLGSYVLTDGVPFVGDCNGAQDSCSSGPLHLDAQTPLLVLPSHRSLPAAAFVGATPGDATAVQAAGDCAVLYVATPNGLDEFSNWDWRPDSVGVDRGVSKSLADQLVTDVCSVEVGKLKSSLSDPVLHRGFIKCAVLLLSWEAVPTAKDPPSML